MTIMIMIFLFAAYVVIGYITYKFSVNLFSSVHRTKPILLSAIWPIYWIALLIGFIGFMFYSK